jgi:hypothetical protein
VDPDGYLLKMRHIFPQAFDQKVKLRTLVLASFANEYVVGLQDNEEAVEAFVLEPSSNIWNTQLVEDEENEIKECRPMRGRRNASAADRYLRAMPERGAEESEKELQPQMHSDAPSAAKPQPSRFS